MKAQNKTLALVLGGAVAATVAMSPVSAAENPFALKPLASGYMVADNSATGDKVKDGKCSTGKCSSSMKKKAKAEEKVADGNCSADKKAKDGNCSADKKAKDGNCSADKK